MSCWDWVVFLVPTVLVLAFGWYSRRYVRGVVDFLSAGRLCGRYLLTIGDIANGISIISILSFVERKYAVGFAVDFWNRLLLPVTITLALTGYCIYRFRETKAQSVGQFLEMRYGSRPFRFYFSAVRVLAEMLAHSIMPAVAARFFIYFLNLPESFTVFGIHCSTFIVLMVVCMSLAIYLICCGGVLTIVLTDTLQGMLCVPIMIILGIFIFLKFDWSNHILPVLADRVSGESFINSFDINQVRDFNLFAIGVSLAATFLHRATWLGGGASGAAKTPHEQKMASLLGQWRGLLGTLLYTLIALSVMVLLNHQDFASQASNIRTEIANRVTMDIIKDSRIQQSMLKAFAAIPEHKHIADSGQPLSKKSNLETPYLEAARQVLDKEPDCHGKVQEFRSLYNQQMMSVTMRHLLGTGLLGLFALLMMLAMVSTDDSYIFSSAQTIAQDLILPFFRKPPSPQLHIWILRLCSIGVGVFFLICCIGFAQMDYIELFRMTVLPIYLGGCGPVLVLGLYSRFGTKQGAWTSMLSGMFIAITFVFLQRNWADMVYPWLEAHGWVENVGNILYTLSKPLHPYVVWEMDPYKLPINAYESYALNMLITLILYIAVSLATCKEPYDLDRMLHRGIYNIDGTEKTKTNWSFRHVFTMLAGITPMHSKGDKVISWSLLLYSYVYSFLGTFLGVAIWNTIQPWPKAWWGYYFLIVFLIVPLFMSLITAIWFWIGGLLDMKTFFHDLSNRTTDDLDNGMVINGVSMSDYEKFNKLNKEKNDSKQQ